MLEMLNITTEQTVSIISTFSIGMNLQFIRDVFVFWELNLFVFNLKEKKNRFVQLKKSVIIPEYGCWKQKYRNRNRFYYK